LRHGKRGAFAQAAARAFYSNLVQRALGEKKHPQTKKILLERGGVKGYCNPKIGERKKGGGIFVQGEGDMRNIESRGGGSTTIVNLIRKERIDSNRGTHPSE